MKHSELRQIRSDLGLTQKRMADLLGLTYYNYRNIEQGQRTVTKDLQDKLYGFLQRRTASVLESTVDWLRIRLKTQNFGAVIEELLGLQLSEMIVAEKSMYSYQHMLTYGNIRVCYTSSIDKRELGTLIDFTGNGCREFELVLVNQGRTWFDFLHEVFKFSETNKGGRTLEDFLTFTRFDIALDELYLPSGNISLHSLRDRVFSHKVLVKQFKNFSAVEGLKKIDGHFINKGLTLNFGSRQSEVFIRFYQKDYEQALLKDVSVQYIREVYGFKNRYELELHDSKAYDVIKEWYTLESDLTIIGTRLLNNYFEVYNDDGSYDEEWDNLIGTSSGFKFVTRPRTVDYQRTKQWVTKQVSSALKLLKIVDAVYNTDELSEIISEAYLSDNHLKIAEEICRRNGVDFEEVVAEIV